MRKIEHLIYKFTEEVVSEGLEKVTSLNELTDFVKQAKSFKPLVMFARNSERSCDVLEQAVQAWVEEEVEEDSERVSDDVVIASLLLIFMQAGCEDRAKNLSRDVVLDDSLFWAKGLANSYLLDREIHDSLRLTS
jgi:hypothetical protein